jgi:hypothetical protein
MASSMARPNLMSALSGGNVPSSQRGCTDTGSVQSRLWRNSRNLQKLTAVLRKFDVRAWFHAAIGFFEHFRPLRNALGDITEVNEVEYTLAFDQLCCSAQATS